MVILIIIAVVVIVIAIIIVTTHDTNAKSQQDKVKTYYRRQKILFFPVSLLYLLIEFFWKNGKYCSYFITKRYFSRHMCTYVANIPLHLIYGKLHCQTQKILCKILCEFFFSISCKCARSIDNIIVPFLFCFLSFFFFYFSCFLFSVVSVLRNVCTPFEFVI